ncbi:hypothetical protein TI05_12275 [Achromatium sp. WMS3]|nr:hypothetical protein TI05_12275 [Achromatium sp. WMS3]
MSKHNRPQEHRTAINKAKEQADHKCEICALFDEEQAGSNVEGHHVMDYGFKGEADSENIIVVCEKHHNEIHTGDISIRKKYP